MKLPKAIRIREVGPREGFQIFPVFVETSLKVRLIDLLSESGLGEIEITSFVRPDLVPQMADAKDLVNAVKTNPKVRYSALYLNQKGFIAAEKTGRLQNQAWLNAACSETFLKKNSNNDLQSILDSIPSWLKLFSESKKDLHGLMLSTAFGCNYEGKIAAAQVCAVISKITKQLEDNQSSLKEVCLADTVGMANPLSIKETLAAVRTLLPDIYLSLHLHDTRGLGLANAYSALQEGIECFDTSIGGIGGCPFSKGSAGNIATEDFVYMCSEIGIDTGVKLDKLLEASALLNQEAGMKIYSRYSNTPVL